MAEGIKKLGLDTPASVVDANIKDCLGSGYCNMGCAYGKKLSALDNILPRAQAEFGDGVRIFSECLAERIETSGGRATEVHCRLSDGRPLRVAANTVVVAGGALASSLLLQRSGLGGELAGHGAQLQRRRAAHRRFRGGAARVRRAADHPHLPARGRGPAHPRVLVQPGRDPGDADAGLVLGPLQQHAPLRPPELHRRRRRLAAERPREARLPGQGNEARLRPHRRGPEADDQGQQARGQDPLRQRRPAGDADDLPLALLQLAGAGRPARRGGPRQHRHRAPHLASPGRQRRQPRPGQGRGRRAASSFAEPTTSTSATPASSPPRSP